MSEKQIEDRLKSYLENDGVVAAKILVDKLHQDDSVPASAAKMALLRLANRSEVRISPDMRVQLSR